MSEPTLEELAGAYVRLRTAVSDMEEAQAEELKPLKDQFATVAAALLNICNEQNLDSVKTPAGTISRRVATSYWTSDWDSMRTFIKEHDCMELLQGRIHRKNMEEFLEENPDLLPAGLQSNRKYTVQVRKPTTKK